MKARYWNIEALPGLDKQQQNLLKSCGVKTTEHLLRYARNTQSKQALANQLRLNIQYVNKWMALADLARLPSVGCQYCGVLLHCGIASVTQLSQVTPHRLHQQILRLEVAVLHRNDLAPRVELVQTWVKEAQLLLKM